MSDDLITAIRDQNRILERQNAILTHLAWVLDEDEQSPTSFFTRIDDWKFEQEREDRR
ncbi:hypothetical protein ZOD2009_19003 [Haladaptatus paucihalophilus DX253]|uniref:Uncharacterized protein n=1 Tax=Haladaptatus paucihalophilus DX253 TaxID=797209 RepID=E7QYB0_HALPU|nr:hypothetical protein [Haladaptatus paucihalophilus]EFW90435.1 hypothetical protein ZOD2009_19003 [Haladaptatus paucihalophilus DX253]SHL68775.1 hypothetical protein SAMN05444342_4418 [Haladaptatus paucihalophilus DX253]